MSSLASPPPAPQPARQRLEAGLLAVDAPDAQVSGRFGSSLLYRFGAFNFHPRAYQVLTNLARLEWRPQDLVLTMFPKSGSTWLSEALFLVASGYNYELASEASIEYRFPQIDSPSHDVFQQVVAHYDHLEAAGGPGSAAAAAAAPHRLVKASIPPGLLVAPGAPAPRFVSILRNPRDVLVSFYHHCKTVKHYDVELTFEQFFDSFVQGQVPCGPIWLMYNETYRYHLAQPESSLVVLYEDMKRDLRGQLAAICAFLGRPQPADEQQWARLLKHLSVDQMRQNKTINRHDWDQLGLRNPGGSEFVRKGQVNDWKNFFSRQQSLDFDRLVTKRLLPQLQRLYQPQDY